MKASLWTGKLWAKAAGTGPQQVSSGDAWRRADSFLVNPLPLGAEGTSIRELGTLVSLRSLVAARASLGQGGGVLPMAWLGLGAVS